MQAAQRGGWNTVDPAQKYCLAVVAKNLFGGPEGVVGGAGGDPEQPAPVETPVGAAMRARFPRGPHQRDASLGQAGQGGTQQIDFADAGLVAGEFHERAQWPTPAGKLLIKPGKTRGNGILAGRVQAGRAPERGVYALGVRWWMRCGMDCSGFHGQAGSWVMG